MEMAPGKTAADAPPFSVASGSNDSLAIVPEKRPANRPGGCVGVFVQFFEWNRRLAKRKFFSRTLLLQDRESKSSSKPSREERTPQNKSSPMIGDENGRQSPNGKMIKVDNGIRSSVSSSEKGKTTSAAPGLVARLMGLDSMPATSRHGKGRKVAVNDAATTGTSAASNAGKRPRLELGLQKPRKASFFDRRPVAAAQKCSEGLVFNRNMMARSKKPHQRLIPPVKSPKVAGRRSSARLMEAASRILEPGLQSRNRARYSLRYSSPAAEENAGLCHNCGSMVELPDARGETAELAGMAEYEPSSSSSSYSSPRLSSLSSHSMCPSERRRAAPEGEEIEELRNLRRAFPAVRKSSLREREVFAMARPSKAMDIQMGRSRAKLDHPLHASLSKRKASMYGNSSRGEFWRRRSAGERGGGEAASFSESSGAESRCADSIISRRLLDRRIDTLSVLLGQKIRELTCPVPDPSASALDLQSARSAAAVLEELISALSVAARPPPPPSEVDISVPRFQDEMMPPPPVNGGFLRHPAGEQRSPLSTLEAPFLYESCFSESLNSSSGRRAHESTTWDVDTELSDSGKSTLTYAMPGRTRVPPERYAWEVISNVELLLGDTYPVVPLLLETLETTPHDPRIRRLTFDRMIEHLDVKYAHLAGAGFRAWLKLPSLSALQLRRELCSKIRACGSPRKIQEDDAEVNGRWVDFHVEAFEWGVDLEDELVRALVNEVVSDLLRVRRYDFSMFARISPSMIPPL